jgi:hypothetical protein
LPSSAGIYLRDFAADDLFPSVSSVAVGADAHLTPGARKPITDPLGLGSSIGMIAVI